MRWIYVLVDDDKVSMLQEQEGLGLFGEIVVHGGPEGMYIDTVNVYDFDVENPQPGLSK